MNATPRRPVTTVILSIRLLLVALAMAGTTACAPMARVINAEQRESPRRFRLERRPAQLTLFDREDGRQYRIDLAARRCYEVHTVLDRCPPMGDIAYCPRTPGAVRESNQHAQAAGLSHTCEQDGCPDLTHEADCTTIRSMDERLTSEMTW